MKFLLAVLGLVVFGFIGVVVYALQVEAPKADIEVVISDENLPR